MNLEAPTASLERALHLSRELLTAADDGDLSMLARIDAERLQLLQSFRTSNGQPAADALSLIREISQLNDRALGLLEHRRRRTERLMDTAAAGRRALVAYSATGLPR